MKQVTIKLESLIAKGACEEQVLEFKKRFGETVVVTEANLLEVSKGFDLDWVADNLLEYPLWEAYEDAEAPLLKAYGDAEAPLLKAYGDACAPLLKAYRDACAPLWKAYEDAKAKLLFSLLAN